MENNVETAVLGKVSEMPKNGILQNATVINSKGLEDRLNNAVVPNGFVLRILIL